MKEDEVTIMSEIGPDLSAPPHVLPILIELFADERQPHPSQQEQLLSHLAICCYCRTAVLVFLSQWLEYDRRNNNPEEPTCDLLEHFVNIHCLIEAREAQEYERLGVSAEAIMYGRQNKI